MTQRFSVGIIGSGVAGAFAAHFLRATMGEHVSITVFEKENRLGGRVRDVEFGGRRIEAGGALIHSSNRYMGQAVDGLGLTRTTAVAARPSAPLAGLWNGNSFDFVTRLGDRDGSDFFARRYGTDVAKLGSLVQGVLSRLLVVYERQRKGEAFDTPEGLCRGLGLYELTQQDGYSLFRESGISDRFALEMSDAISRGNYGQASYMNGFATIISLVGGGFGGGHGYSVVEGNARVCAGLLARAHARLLMRTRVVRVAPKSGDVAREDGYVIVAEDGEAFEFDAVILATPLEQANLRFSDVPLHPGASYRRRYQTTHVTFVEGRLRADYFGLSADSPPPDMVLTKERSDIPFSSISTQGTAADGSRKIYKLFSRQPLMDGLLDTLFGERGETRRLTWQAYPLLNPTTDWPPFRLAPALYYVNAMESPVSTMETEAIGARNVVNLLIQDGIPGARR